MESSNPKGSLYDPVRKKWVEKNPEEIIRQALIQKMVEELDYPLSLLAIEKELCKLPHLQLVPSKEIPKRRADIIAFAKEIHPEFPLFPLLMIECKSVPLTPQFAQQVVGYNAMVKAPFLAIANGSDILTGCFVREVGMFRFKKGLPSFSSLLQSI